MLQRHLFFRAPGEAPWPLNAARLHISLLSFGGPFITTLVCTTLLAVLLHVDPLHTLAARILRARLWRPLAELSFLQYLLHEHARLWVILLLIPPGLLPQLVERSPRLGFACIAGATLAAGYLAALLLHLLLKPWSRKPSELATPVQ